MANEIFKELKTRIALKYNTYEYWTTGEGKDYAPLKGEVCFCAIESKGQGAQTAPTVLFKVGVDGQTKFSALKWASALAADVYDWAKVAGANVFTKDGTGNVISGIEYDATLNGGKGGFKFTTASVATSEGLEELQKDIADNRDAWALDTDTRYSFSTDGDKLVVKKTLYTNGVAGAEEAVGTYEFLTAGEVAETLEDYYTKLDLEGKIHTEEEIKAMEIARATAAGKVDKALTVKVGGADVVFDGSAEKTADVDAAIEAAINAIPEVVHPEYSIIKDTASDYAATYHLTKDGVNVGAAINIPKDMVVEHGEVKELEAGSWGDAGTYIVITLANATDDKLYINVSNLIEYVTSGSATGDMVYVTVDTTTHKVTATITDGTITEAKLHTDVTAKLNKAWATTAQGELADSALQSVTIAGKTLTKAGETSVSADEIATALDLANKYQAKGDYASAEQGTKADTALQKITTTEGHGLKVTNNNNIDIDTDVVFILDCNW